MKQRLVLLSSIVAIAALIAGCGGGGGGAGSGSQASSTNDFALSGTILLSGTSTPVTGVKVTMSGQQTTTDSQGKFRLVLSSPPVVQTYALDVSGASPTCYPFWADANGVSQNPLHIAMPVAPKTGINVGIIYLMGTDNPPPFPPL